MERLPLTRGHLATLGLTVMLLSLATAPVVSASLQDPTDNSTNSTAAETGYSVQPECIAPGPDSDCDADNDGVTNSNDACPSTYGEGSDGCPVETDSDGDGVVNSNDNCPSTYGTSVNGCPVDSDGDDVDDVNDDCDYQDGPASNNGCPYQDSDNDGVKNPYDDCPTNYGEAANGCPVE